MKALEHNLNIAPGAWHERWYRYWLSLGGSSPSYKENLCRYIRILVFWAPGRWFIKGRIKHVPPWVIVLVPVLLALGGYIYQLWPGISLKMLKVAGVFLACLIVLIIFLIGGSELHERSPERMKKLGKWLTSPIWIVPYLITLLCRWIRSMIEVQVEVFLGWYIGKIYPVCLTVLPLLGYIVYLWPDASLKLLMATGLLVAVVVGCVALLVGFVIGGEEVKKRWKTRSSRPKTRMGRFYEALADTVKLGATYAATKKRGSRICPFLEFDKPLE